MDIFYYRQRNQILDEVDDNDAEYDEDMTGKYIMMMRYKRKEIERKMKLSDGSAPIKGEIASGIQGDLPSYMLPHFTMCLVGKPGSGKSTLMKRLIEDDKLYKNKFDDILIVSPSISKLEIDIPDKNTYHEFDFDWVYDWIYKINQRYLRYLYRAYMEYDYDFEHSKRNRKLEAKYSTFINSFNSSLAATTMPARSLQLQNNVSMNQMVNELNRIYRDRQPQNIQNISTMIYMNQASTITQAHYSALGFLRPAYMQRYSRMQDSEYENKRLKNSRQKKKIDMIQKYADEIHKLYKSHVRTKSNMAASHKNILLLLDDVVGEINYYQHSYQLSKLFLNRRHLIANATVSIIVSTQKYTMIPAKIRSSSNWMMLFRLNPVDFELARTDATSYQKKTWANILRFVFGYELIEEKGTDTRAPYFVHGQEGMYYVDHNFISFHVNGNENRLFKKLKEFNIK